MANDLFVVDSNVFVAFYYEGDAHHRDAVEIIKEIDRKTIVLHPYAIQETATVLAYKFGMAAARKFLSDVTNSPNVLIPSVDISNDIVAFIGVRKKVSFADAALVALAKQINADLVTFDRQMLALFKS
ncbi:MAG: hypothetical protein A2946_00390 [Candidatus Liptonbacteria bacterium RIFCSPLOWO2_01_FULL_53_13]|uniref:PIN domain-containing protein n=1 Tax=Candidatus Liptonbacteria bacterium RIFCSPLOWO2_01_FULL_53_13 TaxID=1798651 RepID=A0A1G2CLW6_9BACT|nr:MAG: hypothetical protein A2946_00390 [Candidatus Liptonbacteria bacterium RIFCSPLOWO2_01_FULL_53_13]